MSTKYIFEIDSCPSIATHPIQVQKSMNGALGTKKFITINDFNMMVNSALLHEEPQDTKNSEEIGTPLLPFGTINYARATDSNYERITIVVPKGIVPIRYQPNSVAEIESHMIGLPKLVFDFKLICGTNGLRRIINSNVFALKSGKLNADSPLYVFPFPNVSKGNGQICWGNVTHSDLIFESLETVDNAISMFLGAIFNNDYGLGIVGYKDFAAYLKEKEDSPFNEELLLNSSNPKKLGDLIKNTNF